MRHLSELSLVTSAAALIAGAVATATLAGGYHCNPGHEPAAVRITNVGLVVALPLALLAVVASTAPATRRPRLSRAVAAVELAACLAVYILLRYQTQHYGWGGNCPGG